MKRYNESGRSMIEMLGVLAIIGVLSVGGIAGYTKAMAKYKVNKTIDQITQIAMNIKTLYASQNSYSGIDCGGGTTTGCNILKKAKLVPDEMWNGNTIKNALGAEMKIAAMGTNNEYFRIYFYGIPDDACIELATQGWESGLGDGYVGFALQEVADGDGVTYSYCVEGNDDYRIICAGDGAMSVAKATELCTADDPMGLEWLFK